MPMTTIEATAMLIFLKARMSEEPMLKPMTEALQMAIDVMQKDVAMEMLMGEYDEEG